MIVDAPTGSVAPPVDSRQERVPWDAVARQWPDLKPSDRSAFISAAADCLREARRRGLELSAIPMAFLAFTRSDERWTAVLPWQSISSTRQVYRPARLMDVMAEWYTETAAILSPSESRFFLQCFLGDELQDHGNLRYTAAAVVQHALRQVSARHAAIYNDFLKKPLRTGSLSGLGSVTAAWQPDSRILPDQLAEAIRNATQDPTTRFLKRTSRGSVFRCTLWDREVMVKHYRQARWSEKVKYAFRSSKARRAWAAAHTLWHAGIPTPRPLGILEIRLKGLVTDSYYLSEYLTGSESAFHWVKRHYHRQSPDWQNAFRQELWRALFQFYRNGIYHADTKLANLLIRDPELPDARQFYWIDLECVQPGRIASPRQIIRNLVQLNTSARSRTPESDRMAFLALAGQYYPWLDTPGVAVDILRWTEKRWRKELERRTPPEGASLRHAR